MRVTIKNNVLQVFEGPETKQLIFPPTTTLRHVPSRTDVVAHRALGAVSMYRFEYTDGKWTKKVLKFWTGDTHKFEAIRGRWLIAIETETQAFKIWDLWRPCKKPMTVQPQKKETVVPGCGISGFNEFVYAWESQHCTNVRAINLTNRSKRISRGTVHKWTLPKSVTRIAAGQECLAYAKEQRVHVIEYGKKAARRRAHWKSDKLPSDPTALCWQKGKLVAWSDQGARTEFSPPLKR